MRTEKNILYMNRTALIWILYLILLLGVNKTSAQSEQKFDVTTSLLPTSSQLTESRPSIGMLSKDKKQTTNHNGIVSGIIMISSGTIIALTSHFVGEDYYDKYKKSAFTENTDRLRKKVTACNALQIGGGVLAGAGFIVMMVSF
jgi:hypothetical protein